MVDLLENISGSVQVLSKFSRNLYLTNGEVPWLNTFLQAIGAHTVRFPKHFFAIFQCYA